MSDPLMYFAGDEEPPWVETIIVNGEYPDLSDGWTFVVRIVRDDLVELEKVAGIVGDDDGGVTVSWAAGELALTPGHLVVLLKATRTDDAHELTIIRKLHIRPRYDDSPVYVPPLDDIIDGGEP